MNTFHRNHVVYPKSSVRARVASAFAAVVISSAVLGGVLGLFGKPSDDAVVARATIAASETVVVDASTRTTSAVRTKTAWCSGSDPPKHELLTHQLPVKIGPTTAGAAEWATKEDAPAPASGYDSRVRGEILCRIGERARGFELIDASIQLEQCDAHEHSPNLARARAAAA